MNFKKILIIFFFFLQSCGFTPIYSNKDNQNILISIENIRGDNQILYSLKSFLDRHITNNTGEAYILNLDIDYKKNSIGRNLTGQDIGYNLIAITKVSLKYQNINKNFEITEKFTIDSFSNTNTEEEYIRSIKNNFAESIYQKIIQNILSIK